MTTTEKREVIVSPPHKRKKKKKKFSKKDKIRAITYVEQSGYWKVRLAKYLKTSVDTLDRRLKVDAKFADELQAAEAEFVRNLVQKAKPDFILKSKYKDEFPENSFDPGAGQGSEVLEAVIVRIRRILPPAGQ